MPGANARALEKAKDLLADVVILDLEDAVAPDAKTEARNTVANAVKMRGYGKREVVVRINDLDTEWGANDLESAVAAKPDAILAPKVTSSEDIELLNDALDKTNAPKDMGLWVMIETPKALFKVYEIAEASQTTRLSAFVMGTNDLAKELRAVNNPPERTAFQSALNSSVAAARSFDLAAIDGVFNDIGNEIDLLAECEQGRLMGFDGKTLIHPSQLETANRVFSPAAEEVDHANAIIQAFAAPENVGKGVLKVNGKMTELLHLEEAKRTVAVAKAITELSA